MKISKYTSKVEINEEVCCIFNRLVMKPLYVSIEEANKILDLNVTESYTEELLCKAGIYIKNEDQDVRALQILQSECNRTQKRIDLMYLIVSQSCNLSCKYCFEEQENGNWKNMLMTRDVALVAIDQFVKHIKAHNVAHPKIMFFGGEPLLNWQTVKETILYAEKTNVHFEYSIVTNATLLNEEMVKFLAKYQVGVGVSIDGPKHINDKNRVYRTNTDSVYDKVMEKLELLKKFKCTYGYSMTNTDDILEHRDEFNEWIKNQNVTNIFLNLLHFSSYNDNWREFYERSTDFMVENFNILLERGTLNGRIYRHFDSLLERKFKFADCAAIGVNQMVIKANGDMYICQCECKKENNFLGNIEEISFDKALEDPIVENWVNIQPVFNPQCRNCECLFVCGGGCPTQANHLFPLDKFDYSYCIFMKKTLKWMLQYCNKY